MIIWGFFPPNFKTICAHPSLYGLHGPREGMLHLINPSLCCFLVLVETVIALCPGRVSAGGADVPASPGELGR